MPEGDTLYRTAVTLRKALLGETVTSLESPLPPIRTILEDSPVAGRSISQVEARGKNLLITLAAPEGSDAPAMVLYTHLRMTGSWHIYRPGERWRKPADYAKVVVRTENWVAPCFSAPTVELLTQRQADRHPALVGLGPDAITVGFDPEEAVRRMRARPELELGVALLNQRLMAGVGNVYKSEVMFLNRVSPFLKIGDLPEEKIRAMVDDSHRLLRLNRDEGQRRTMFGLREGDRLWVYGRSGEPCRICGHTVRMRRQGLDARSTYYCPNCQR
jgi:endonuclease-8